MVGVDEDLTGPEKRSRDRGSRSKVIQTPTYDRPPPPVPMPPGDNESSFRPPRRSSTRTASADVRFDKQAKQDEDIVMVDAGGPSENLGSSSAKRVSSSAKKAAGFGLLGGLLSSNARPEHKRRSTALTDDEGLRGLRREDRKIKRPARERSGIDGVDADVRMTGGAVEEDQEARRAARRARRAEREAAEKAAENARKAKEDERRERHRKREEEAETRRLEEKEARRTARREQKAREEAERRAIEAKEAERAERRRARRAEREAEKAAQTDAEPLTEDPGRSRRPNRRRSHREGSVDDEERRRRREERRARRISETPRTSRRASAPVVDSYFDPRNGSKSRGAEPEFLPADGPVYKSSSRRRKPGWPHSGTDSWVQETSDAPPPPDVAPNVDTPADDLADENERRRLRKTRDEDSEERRRRRDSRRQSRQDRETLRSSEGSQENGRRSSRRDSGFVESRAPSAQGGLFSRWKNLI
jgi:hypothetical protein